MKPHRNASGVPRRTFVRQGVGAACAVAAVGGMAALLRESHRVSEAGVADSGHRSFEYSTAHLERIDPALIRFAEQSVLKCARNDPKCIALGPDDRLHVAAGKYVSVLNSTGAVESEIALSEPARCLAVGADERVYVGLRQRVEVFDSNGRRRFVYEPTGSRVWLTGIAVGSDSVFVAYAGNRVVLRYDLGGELIGRIGDKDPARGIPGFVIPSPHFAISLHPDGTLLAANPGRHRVECYTPNGELRVFWGRASADIDGFCGCCNPVSLASLSDGRCVTAEKGICRVKVYSEDGRFESVVAGPESFAGLDGESGSSETEHAPCVAIDSKGRVLILDPAGSKVRVFKEMA